MSYKPRAGSLADRVINHLKTTGGEISSIDLSKRFKTATNNTNALLKDALSSGTLVKRKDETGHVWYGLGAAQWLQEPPPLLDAIRNRKASAAAPAGAPAPADDTDPLTMARWSDGDLVITGHATTEEGAVVLTREQVKQLLLFVLPHYDLPGVAFLMNEAFKQQLLGD